MNNNHLTNKNPMNLEAKENNIKIGLELIAVYFKDGKPVKYEGTCTRLSKGYVGRVDNKTVWLTQAIFIKKSKTVVVIKNGSNDWFSRSDIKVVWGMYSIKEKKVITYTPAEYELVEEIPHAFFNNKYRELKYYIKLGNDISGVLLDINFIRRKNEKKTNN